MTSKEAFKELKENAQEICEWELVRLNTIEKDLEVLEILKNVFNYKSIQQFIDSMSKEEWLKIKEWYNGSLRVERKVAIKQ